MQGSIGLQPRFDPPGSLESVREMQTADCDGNGNPQDTSKASGSQTAAEAGRMVAFIGRLKPPSGTVARAFFRKPESALIECRSANVHCVHEVPDALASGLIDIFEPRSDPLVRFDADDHRIRDHRYVADGQRER